MTRHGPALRRATRMVCVGLLAICAVAKDQSPAFRVVRLDVAPGGRMEDRVMRECDVVSIVTRTIQGYQPKKRRPKGSPPTDLALRVDRVARVGGGPGGHNFGGTDLANSVLSANGRDVNQAFFCRADGTVVFRNVTHCARLEYCGEKIADQISTWLIWQTAN